MSYSHGMNADAVREQAAGIDSAATELRTLEAAIERTVAGLGQQWRGADMERFQGWWRDQHKPALTRIVEAIAGLSQSARNNADEQDAASENRSGLAQPGPSGVGSPPTDPQGGSIGAPGTPAGNIGGGTGELRDAFRTPQEAQRAYEAAEMGYYRAGGPSSYQCTAWANFRWRELGYEGFVSGDGGEMAGRIGGTVDTTPGLGAMVSDPGGNHVMIVESISADGSTATISEFNTGSDGSSWRQGNPEEFRSDGTITRGSDGHWYRRAGGPPLVIANIS